MIIIIIIITLIRQSVLSEHAPTTVEVSGGLKITEMIS